MNSGSYLIIAVPQIELYPNSCQYYLINQLCFKSFLPIYQRIVNFKNQLPLSYQCVEINPNFKTLLSDWLANPSQDCLKCIQGSLIWVKVRVNVSHTSLQKCIVFALLDITFRLLFIIIFFSISLALVDM